MLGIHVSVSKNIRGQTMFDSNNDDNKEYNQSEQSEQEEYQMLNLLEGLPLREKVIGKDDIINIQIALGTTKDVAEFIELM